MSVPPPDQCEVIDKFAAFVARKGFEFENLTKQQQQGNPKFSFLYGGPFFSYYL